MQLTKREQIEEFYRQNSYVCYLDITIEKLDTGKVRIKMPVDKERHVNFYGFAHGGALASIIDTAMGCTCLSVGKKVVTLELNFNCIRPALAGGDIFADASIIHNGRKTIVAEAEVTDAEGRILAKARGSFYVTDTFGEETGGKTAE